MNRNPVAKYAGKFCRSSVVPNSKKDYAPSVAEGIEDADEEYSIIQWVTPSGDTDYVYFKSNVEDDLLTQMRLELIAADCTFVRVFKNGEEIL